MADVPEWKRKLYAAKGQELPAAPAKAGEGVQRSPAQGPSEDEDDFIDEPDYDFQKPPAQKAKQDGLGGKASGKAAGTGTARPTAVAGRRRDADHDSDLGNGDDEDDGPPQPQPLLQKQKKPSKGSAPAPTSTSEAAAAASTKGKKQPAAGRKGAITRTETLVRSGAPRVLRNHKKALALFQDEKFDVDGFIGCVYQDVNEKGVEAGSHELMSLKEHCHQQVQGVVQENYKLFLECCKSRTLLDEAVTELRGHVQDTTSLVELLKQARQATQQQAASVHMDHYTPTMSFFAASPSFRLGPGITGPSFMVGGSTPGLPSNPGLAGGSITGRVGSQVARPVADTVEVQLRNLLLQLDVAVAEREYGTAVSLLGLAGDVLSVISRDADVLAKEVGDISNWRQGWEMAVAEHHKALVSGLESYLSRGGVSLSAVEMRGAAAALSALSGDVHAATVLLACHSERLGTVQSLLLRYHMSATTGSEHDAQQFAAALCQRAFLGIGAAADDVAAVWGRAGAPAAAFLARWAEGEARAAARAVRQQALLPYVDGASLTSTVMIMQVGLVVCGTLEMSHALSLTAPFMAELWFHLEEVIDRMFMTMTEDIQIAARKEVIQTLKQQVITMAAEVDGKESASGRRSGGVGGVRAGSKVAPRLDVDMTCTRALVSQLAHMARITAPFAGARLASALRPGVVSVLAALLDGIASALHEENKGAGNVVQAVASVGRSVKSHLLSVLEDTGPLTQALAPLVPACGSLIELSELRAAVAAATAPLDARLEPLPPMSSSTARPSGITTSFSTRRASVVSEEDIGRGGNKNGQGMGQGSRGQVDETDGARRVSQSEVKDQERNGQRDAQRDKGKGGGLSRAVGQAAASSTANGNRQLHGSVHPVIEEEEEDDGSGGKSDVSFVSNEIGEREFAPPAALQHTAVKPAAAVSNGSKARPAPQSLVAVAAAASAFGGHDGAISSTVAALKQQRQEDFSEQRHSASTARLRPPIPTSVSVDRSSQAGRQKQPEQGDWEGASAAVVAAAASRRARLAARAARSDSSGEEGSGASSAVAALRQRRAGRDAIGPSSQPRRTEGDEVATSQPRLPLPPSTAMRKVPMPAAIDRPSRVVAPVQEVVSQGVVDGAAGVQVRGVSAPRARLPRPMSSEEEDGEEEALAGHQRTLEAWRAPAQNRSSDVGGEELVRRWAGQRTLDAEERTAPQSGQRLSTGRGVRAAAPELPGNTLSSEVVGSRPQQGAAAQTSSPVRVRPQADAPAIKQLQRAHRHLPTVSSEEEDNGAVLAPARRTRRHLPTVSSEDENDNGAVLQPPRARQALPGASLKSEGHGAAAQMQRTRRSLPIVSSDEEQHKGNATTSGHQRPGMRAATLSAPRTAVLDVPAPSRGSAALVQARSSANGHAKHMSYGDDHVVDSDGGERNDGTGVSAMAKSALHLVNQPTRSVSAVRPVRVDTTAGGDGAAKGGLRGASVQQAVSQVPVAGTNGRAGGPPASARDSLAAKRAAAAGNSDSSGSDGGAQTVPASVRARVLATAQAVVKAAGGNTATESRRLPAPPDSDSDTPIQRARPGVMVATRSSVGVGEGARGGEGHSKDDELGVEARSGIRGKQAGSIKVGGLTAAKQSELARLRARALEEEEENDDDLLM